MAAIVRTSKIFTAYLAVIERDIRRIVKVIPEMRFGAGCLLKMARRKYAAIAIHDILDIHNTQCPSPVWRPHSFFPPNASNSAAAKCQ